MAKRQSAPAQPTTVQDRDALVNALSRLGEIDRTEADELARVEQEHAIALQNAELGLKAVRDERAKLLKDVQTYCEAHKSELLPKGKKSADLGVGTIGWRQNPPSVKLLRPAEEVVEALLSTENEQDAELLRETYTLDKDAVLALRTKRETVLAKMREPGTDAAIAQAALDELTERLDRYASDKLFRVVVGSEKFFVEPVSATKTTSEVAA